MPTPPPGTDGSSGSTGSERSDDAAAVSDALHAPDAVVYDLDGTLVDLAVDWDAVADDVIGTYAANALVAPTADLWTLLDAAADYGVHDAVEETIPGHERPAAPASTRPPPAHRPATRGAARPWVPS